MNSIIRKEKSNSIYDFFLVEQDDKVFLFRAEKLAKVDFKAAQQFSFDRNFFRR